MSVFAGMRISASALQAERTRLDVISENLANLETTRTPQGGPYRRRQVVLGASQVSFGRLSRWEGVTPRHTGVRVLAVEPAPGDLPRIYNPGHPDADAEGYVTMPNVDLPTEMADLLVATRAYEANAAAFRSSRDLIRQCLSIMA